VTILYLTYLKSVAMEAGAQQDGEESSSEEYLSAEEELVGSEYSKLE